jgi:hypothetical protein
MGDFCLENHQKERGENVGGLMTSIIVFTTHTVFKSRVLFTTTFERRRLNS